MTLQSTPQRGVVVRRTLLRASVLALLIDAGWAAWFAIGYDASGAIGTALHDVTDISVTDATASRATLVYAHQGDIASVYLMQDVEVGGDSQLRRWIAWSRGSVNGIEKAVPAIVRRVYDGCFRGATDDPTHRCAIHTVGWPARLLWCASTRKSQEWRVSASTGVQLPDGRNSRSSQYLNEFGRVIPLRPIWTGQALLFGVCVLSILSCEAVRCASARLRAVSGRCRACGYDLRGNPHAGCPECGAGRR